MLRNQDWVWDFFLYLLLIALPAVIGGASIQTIRELKAGSYTAWSALGLLGNLLLLTYLIVGFTRRSQHSTAIAFSLWPILAWIGGAALRVFVLVFQ